MFKLLQPNCNKLSLISLLLENMDDGMHIKGELQDAQTVQELFNQWSRYDSLAKNQQLYSIPFVNIGNNVNAPVLKNISYHEFILLYTNYFSKRGKTVRRVYDEILSKSDRCPFCGNIGHSSQLDHFLPKKYYPQYSVYPNNLIPICRDCNEGFKKIHSARLEEEQLIHPYFNKDIFFDEQWIYAEYQATSLDDPTATLRYFTNPPVYWDDIDKLRVNKHFDILGLGLRFSIEANNKLQTLIPQLNVLNANLSRNQLADFCQESALNRPINHWERVMYQAIYNYIIQVG